MGQFISTLCADLSWNSNRLGMETTGSANNHHYYNNNSKASDQRKWLGIATSCSDYFKTPIRGLCGHCSSYHRKGSSQSWMATHCRSPKTNWMGMATTTASRDQIPTFLCRRSSIPRRLGMGKMKNLNSQFKTCWLVS